MAFDIVVSGRSDRTLRHALSEFVDAPMLRWLEDSFVLTVVDQAALVTAVARLNDLGLAIERVVPAIEC